MGDMGATTGDDLVGFTCGGGCWSWIEIAKGDRMFVEMHLLYC